MTNTNTTTARKSTAVARAPFAYEKIDVVGDVVARIQILAFIADRKAGKAWVSPARPERGGFFLFCFFQNMLAKLKQFPIVFPIDGIGQHCPPKELRRKRPARGDAKRCRDQGCACYAKKFFSNRPRRASPPLYHIQSLVRKKSNKKLHTQKTFFLAFSCYSDKSQKKSKKRFDSSTRPDKSQKIFENSVDSAFLSA